MPTSVSTIASMAFVNSALTSVTIGNSVTTLGGWAFAYASITDVTIPGSVGNISGYAFLNCRYLTNVTMLSGITAIGPWAFDACVSMATVYLAASVESIGPLAFEECNGLTNIYFSGNAPMADRTAFQQAAGTIDYLPGTIGWTNAFAGLPTALWYLPNPVIPNNCAGFIGAATGFGFTISWATNSAVAVEASTNLVNWKPAQTNMLVGGSATFCDPQWTNYSKRFYRLCSP